MHHCRLDAHVCRRGQHLLWQRGRGDIHIRRWQPQQAVSDAPAHQVHGRAQFPRQGAELFAQFFFEYDLLHIVGFLF